ncbi:MAG: hypothetical protein ACRENU_03860, partial [Gemmatimonadaceae bacterium]
MSDAIFGAGPQVFVGYYPTPTVVEATASGVISWTASYGGGGGYGPGGVSSNGIGGAGVHWRLPDIAHTPWMFSYAKDISPWPGSGSSPITVVLTVNDSVKVSRTTNGNPNNFYWYCGPMWGTWCLTYSGSTTLALTRILSQISLTADSTNVGVGSTVTFRHTYTVTSHQGTPLPRQIIRRVWIPDDTSLGGSPLEVPDSVTACTVVNDSTCTRVIQGSGTMRYVARVNGQEQTDSVHINAAHCPTGDPILDDPVFRRGADSVWKLSKANDTTQRIERAMLFFDSAGKKIVVIKPIEPQDNPCRNGLGA